MWLSLSPEIILGRAEADPWWIVDQILGFVAAMNMFRDFAEHTGVNVLAVDEFRILPFEEIDLEMAGDVTARFQANDLPVVVIKIPL